ncbi:MAG: glycosyltransferase family 9 protein [Rhodocyclaceae bacterium]|nr:glycosyltransferase family 9 protein [Rhodocyclaceae bacterium]
MKILIIRRDNIGDLLCTTPLLAALRQTYADAWIGVLANAYNAPVLDGNPDVDEVFRYRKAKHRQKNESRLAIWWETVRLLMRLRRRKLDIVLCASPGASRLARFLAPRRCLESDRSGPGHEVEITFRLASALGIDLRPGPLVLQPEPMRAQTLKEDYGIPNDGGTIALHLSARKPRQRWPSERFEELVYCLLHSGLCRRVLLFWAPGGADDPYHPGDDAIALRLQKSLAHLPLHAIKTQKLADLIAGLSLADAVICSDGGAMHIAAALGKPIVCLFGNSDPTRWHPWGVPYELLRKESHTVADIAVAEVLDAYRRLRQRLQSGSFAFRAP